LSSSSSSWRSLDVVCHVKKTCYTHPVILANFWWI
jgi:hypothetical protein